eukprot:843137-Prymnesium_polylepis.1
MHALGMYPGTCQSQCVEQRHQQQGDDMRHDLRLPDVVLEQASVGRRATWSCVREPRSYSKYSSTHVRFTVRHTDRRGAPCRAQSPQVPDRQNEHKRPRQNKKGAELAGDTALAFRHQGAMLPRPP